MGFKLDGSEDIATDHNSIVLEDSLVLLRPVSIDDVNCTYIKWMNDVEVNIFMETQFRQQTRESIEKFVKEKRNEPNTLFLAIINKKDLKHVGNIKLGPISNEHKRGDISFFIGEKEYWGMGLTTAAVGLVTDYALSKLRLRKICGGCYSNNIGSQMVFKKAGYTLEATRRSHNFSQGTWVDQIYFAKYSVSDSMLPTQGAFS